jgi:hypothetical protein
VINALQSTAVIRALIGLVQGAALFLLYDAVTEKMWPATNGEIFAPLLTVALFVPAIVVAALDNMRMRTLAIWAVAATIVCAGLAFYDIFRSPFEPYGGAPRPGPTLELFFALAAGLFISHSLIAAGEAEHRLIASYPRYFDVSWKQGVQLVLAILFVGVFWGLLWLGAELFRLIKIETLSELIAKRWFAIPVTTLATTCALHVTETAGHRSASPLRPASSSRPATRSAMRSLRYGRVGRCAGWKPSTWRPPSSSSACCWRCSVPRRIRSAYPSTTR